jgi:hypothetical protein
VNPEPHAAPADEAAVLQRIRRLMAILAVLGAGACFAWSGKSGAMSFLGGAALSATSLWSLQKLVNLFSAEKPGPLPVAFLTLRFLMIAGVAYVIVRTYEVFLPAVALGLLLSVAAITLEALYELIYARA